MAIEDDRGAQLARAVADAVNKKHPTVKIDLLPHSELYHGSVVRFTPPSKRSAPVVLAVNYDRSFQLESGRLVLIEDEIMNRSEAEHIERIVAEIDKIATEGVQSGRIDGLIGRNDPVGPWVRAPGKPS